MSPHSRVPVSAGQTVSRSAHRRSAPVRRTLTRFGGEALWDNHAGGLQIFHDHRAEVRIGEAVAVKALAKK